MWINPPPNNCLNLILNKVVLLKKKLISTATFNYTECINNYNIALTKLNIFGQYEYYFGQYECSFVPWMLIADHY